MVDSCLLSCILINSYHAWLPSWFIDHQQYKYLHIRMQYFLRQALFPCSFAFSHIAIILKCFSSLSSLSLSLHHTWNVVTFFILLFLPQVSDLFLIYRIDAVDSSWLGYWFFYWWPCNRWPWHWSRKCTNFGGWSVEDNYWLSRLLQAWSGLINIPTGFSINFSFIDHSYFILNCSYTSKR